MKRIRIFTTVSRADAPPLSEFLGGYAWYLDTIFKRSKRGLRMLGAPQRFVVKANWKAAAEQFSGADGYHLMTLHRSLIAERYVYADFLSGKVWLRGASGATRQVGSKGLIASFGVSGGRELFAVSFDGGLYALTVRRV